MVSNYVNAYENTGNVLANNMADGQMATFTDDFEKLTGQKTLTVRQIFEDLENHLVGQRTSTEK
jgi:hypothetical protein